MPERRVITAPAGAGKTTRIVDWVNELTMVVDRKSICLENLYSCSQLHLCLRGKCPMTDLLDNLTDRENEILACLVEGLSNAEIALRLHLAPQTVRWYNSQIYSKLDVNNRNEAVAKATSLGLLQHDLLVESIRHNLPAQTTPFIGRESELDELMDLFTSEHIRLVTILALGGMGKTRLALKVAEQLVQMRHIRYQDGIFFVPLQPLSDPQHIIMQIASNVGYKFLGDASDPNQQLLEYLSDKRLLLVMDNWEHLLVGASLVTDLLAAAPELRILATSREKLNLSGETVYSLGGMKFPEWETPEDALDYDAVQLLVQSAQRFRPDWHIESDNLDYVTRVCHMTGGMPLGIVLAVSWLDTLSLRDIANELHRSLDFLATEMRDAPDRQTSIRAVFDYSWKQLKTVEREVFMKLSVFRDGFTRDAAQAVCDTNIHILQVLVNKALVTRTDSGRYEVHELLRQYASEHLQQEEFAETIYDSHGVYFLNWLTNLEAEIKGKRQVGALDDIEADFENIRVAWGNNLEQSRFDLIRESSESLYLYCEMRSRFAEGQELFAKAVEYVPEEDEYESIWSRLILCMHRLIESPDPDNERDRAIKIAEETTSLTDMAMGLLIEGRSKWINQRKFEAAQQYFEQAHDLFRSLGDEYYAAYAINRIGLGHSLQGNRTKGIEFTRRSADLQRQMGDLSGLGISLNNLGAFNFLIDEYEHSIHILRENITVGKESKNSGNLAFSYGMLGLVYCIGGEFEEAHDLATHATTLGHDVGYFQATSLGTSTLGLLTTIVDEDYDLGLATSREGIRLAKMSNRVLQIWGHCAMALAMCGLQYFDEARKELENIVQSEWHSIPIWGIVCTVWTFCCVETQAYEQAVRYLSFIMNADYATFRWAKKWSLLQDLQEDLSAQIDKATFTMLQDEGRQLSLDEITQRILLEIA